MKIKLFIIFIVSILFFATGPKPVFALEHTQKSGLFKMDIPEEWRWNDFPQETVITFPDGKTMAIDIQMVPSRKLPQADIKKMLKESNDKMITEGVEAHNGTLIDNKEMKLDGVYATRLDFKTTPPNPIYVTYISFFNKGFAFTITYGSKNDKMRFLMDDVLTTLKFRKNNI